MRRIWGAYRGLRTTWQVVIGGVMAVALLSAASGPTEGEAPVRAAAVGDIADDLPFAPTTTTRPPTTELAPTTTAAPTTTVAPTTTAAPTTTTEAPTTTSPPTPPTTIALAPAPAASGGSCHPSYDPCVPYASDVDCAGGSGNGPAYTGFVRVIGPDEYDLDRDGDGMGCE